MIDMNEWEMDFFNHLSSVDLLNFVKKISDENNSSTDFEAIINHQNANADVFHAVFEAKHEDAQLMNALATSMKCPLSVLDKLETSESRSVAEHAKINKLHRNISKLTEFEMMEIIKKHNIDSMLDVGMRSVIAISQDTPIKILQELCNDDFDFIAAQAKENLKNRK